MTLDIFDVKGSIRTATYVHSRSISRVLIEGGTKMRLKDKVALVTGGAQGIGRQICLTFANEAADIIIGDVDLHQARKT